jgi:hypothetical protein
MEKSPLSIPALSTDIEGLRNLLITPRTNTSSRGIYTNREINDAFNLQDRVSALE